MADILYNCLVIAKVSLIFFLVVPMTLAWNDVITEESFTPDDVIDDMTPRDSIADYDADLEKRLSKVAPSSLRNLPMIFHTSIWGRNQGMLSRRLVYIYKRI